jgi:DNA-binding transcriptional regulator YhcF (GntR family)
MVEQPGTIGVESFDVAIDRAAEVPIGLQLAWALRTRIREGTFKPGQRLPGLRDLAEGIGVNVNTVRAVYQRLEHDGLIESRQGSGTFVAPTIPGPSAAGTIAAEAAREALASGADPREVAAALYVTAARSAHVQPAGPDSAGGADDGAAIALASREDDPREQDAARRRALRSQIAALERAIAKMEVEHPGLVPRATAGHRRLGPTLLSAEQLEEVRSDLVRRLAIVQSAIDDLRRRAAGQGEATTSSTAAAQPTPAPAPAAATTRKPADTTTRKPAGSRKAKARPATAGA